ncbi:hypothetical protein CEXT_557851 [Caerostris extrusa]|uniref:Uncharacterized protein n=1 Tax=Caerostris extrusa TaxID=172846 RepID=A0AAV4PWR1_CAEEX|nr:hypothetical protein CEXT_557851 [Caerostris extrusa]
MLDIQNQSSTSDILDIGYSQDKQITLLHHTSRTLLQKKPYSFNCDHFHRSSVNCRRQIRCLKCGYHLTAACHITKEVNGHGHIASWRGCKAFPKVD